MPIDYADYPANWRTEIRPRILEREKNRCKFCGVPNYEFGSRDVNGDWHDERSIDGMNSDVGESLFGTYCPKIIRIVLTIAHLDHDITNNTDENLAALCQKCHNTHDRDHRKANAANTFKKKKNQLNLFIKDQ